MIERLKPIIAEVSNFQQRNYNKTFLRFDFKKNPSDIVSEVDQKSQQMLIREIKKLFPKSGILAEEEGVTIDIENEYVFVIDPLDGTSNFRGRIDLWGISIGLLKNGRVHEGIIALPTQDLIVCSTDIKSQVYPTIRLNDIRFYCVDRHFDHINLTTPYARKRIIGATVPTIFYCFQKSLDCRPCFDFALIGGSKIWDIAGIAACLKKSGGSLIATDGTDLLDDSLFDLKSKDIVQRQVCYPCLATHYPALIPELLSSIQK